MNKINLQFLALTVLSSFYSAAFADQASDFCERFGGEVQVHSIYGKEVDVCDLGGSKIGQNTLYRYYSEKKAPTAIDAFLRHPEFKPKKTALIPVFETKENGEQKLIGFKPDPTVSEDQADNSAWISSPVIPTYCRQLEGKTERMISPKGKAGPVCIFKDGSGIEAETLYKGPQKMNAELLKLAQQKYAEKKKMTLTEALVFIQKSKTE
jgi:putative hemolysin